MVNPYNPPSLAQSDPRSMESVPAWARRWFGLFPGAIIASYLIESILFPTRGWNVDDWFWTVVPPGYLAGVWIFARFSDHGESQRPTVWLIVLMIPLLLYALLVWSRAVNWCIFVSKSGLNGFGINDHYRMFAISLPLWLAASAVYTLYFACLMRRLRRFHSDG